jgi:uncharacterized protein YkwD
MQRFLLPKSSLHAPTRRMLVTTARTLLLAGAVLMAAFAFLQVHPGPERAAAITNCSASDGTIDASEQRLLDLVNQARTQAGVGTLAMQSTLANAAAWKSSDPTSDLGPNARHEPDSLGRSFDQRMSDCGIHGGYNGEVIGWSDTPDGVFALFMGEPFHKMILLDRTFRSAGVGRHGTTWTIDFSSLVDSTSGGSAATSTPTSTPTQPPTPTPIPTPSPTSTPPPPPIWRLVLPLIAGVDR